MEHVVRAEGAEANDIIHGGFREDRQRGYVGKMQGVN